MEFGASRLGAGIAARARACGLVLSGGVVEGLAAHARLVLERNPVLHLTTITEPREFLERHLGEAFEGASLLGADSAGRLLDLGSGNGYPGVPLAAARPGLRAVLAEASSKRAGFLREVAALPGLPVDGILHRQIQRPGDVIDTRTFRVISARAVGDWQRVLPRLVPLLDPGAGEILLWAGVTAETVARRASWRRLRLVRRHPLPGRARSWIWVFRAGPPPRRGRASAE